MLKFCYYAVNADNKILHFLRNLYLLNTFKKTSEILNNLSRF